MAVEHKRLFPNAPFRPPTRLKLTAKSLFESHIRLADEPVQRTELFATEKLASAKTSLVSWGAMQGKQARNNTQKVVVIEELHIYVLQPLAAVKRNCLPQRRLVGQCENSA